jgi:hypothetical protein
MPMAVGKEMKVAMGVQESIMAVNMLMDQVN